MRIDIVSVQPQLLDGPFAHSIIRRARDKGLLEVHVHDLRRYGRGRHRQLDDYAFGGGAGMVLQLEPLVAITEALQAERDYDEVVYLTPDGEPLRQPRCNSLSLRRNLLLVCGHYKGIDQRYRDHFVTLEISIGDYVLSGGELAAAVLTDAIGRLLPGVLNDETSALTDSFQDGLLAPPVYTRPKSFRGWEVPEILLSGHEAKIAEWRAEQAERRTRERRPDLLADSEGNGDSAGNGDGD